MLVNFQSFKMSVLLLGLLFGLFVKLVSQKFSQGLFFNIFWCDFLHYHFDLKMAIKLPNFSKIISSFKSKSSKKNFWIFVFFFGFSPFFPAQNRPKVVSKLLDFRALRDHPTHPHVQNFWSFALYSYTK